MNAAADQLVRTALEQLRRGNVDRSLLNDNLAYFFTPVVLGDYKAGISSLGTIQKLQLLRDVSRGGMTGLLYEVTGTSGVPATVFVYITKEGRLDQLLISRSQ